MPEASVEELDEVGSFRLRFRVSYGQQAVEDPFAQVRIARAASGIDAAWLQLTRNTADLFAIARSGRKPSTTLRARARPGQVLATERAVDAVDLLMETMRSGALRNDDGVLQNLHAGCGQAANDTERAPVLVVKGAPGLAVEDPLL
ncbi:hypothetical protein ACFU8Q_39270 [Streptomyces sp. NPDC057543]|uniref:hypothetical protein n=1 Tax=Streptomyces sp. NPDC057543 TaxID=3346163 RepID=UPI0036C50683